ncbi:hypothetical protein GCM10027614_51390 [Micromonospora vulcania]
MTDGSQPGRTYRGQGQTTGEKHLLRDVRRHQLRQAHRQQLAGHRTRQLGTAAPDHRAERRIGYEHQVVPQDVATPEHRTQDRHDHTEAEDDLRPPTTEYDGSAEQCRTELR